MAPGYRPSAQAADWQRPIQPNPYTPALYLPSYGLAQYSTAGVHTLVGPFQPVFAGVVRPPPPPAPRIHRDHPNNLSNNGFQQQGPAPARSTWSHPRLNQRQHPVLGQHSKQRSAASFTSRAPLNSNATPYVAASRGSSVSSSTADLPEASASSSNGSTTSEQTGSTGESCCLLSVLSAHVCLARSMHSAYCVYIMQQI